MEQTKNIGDDLRDILNVGIDGISVRVIKAKFQHIAQKYIKSVQL